MDHYPGKDHHHPRSMSRWMQLRECVGISSPPENFVHAGENHSSQGIRVSLVQSLKLPPSHSALVPVKLNYLTLEDQTFLVVDERLLN